VDTHDKKGVLFMFSRIIKRYKELNWLAYHDSLTGLKNRNWLYKNADNIKFHYVYFVDINGLHEINKSGHTVGDAHICGIVEEIKLLPNIEFVRYAGDEFVVFSDSLDTLQQNDLYAFGIAEIGRDLFSAIRKADEEMIIAKSRI
jgi:GGDEF domain-containing protein